jgi:SAM-dependent methyltransferase
MPQITTGLRAILSSPRVYNTFQAIMGARRGRRLFSQFDVRAKAGDKVLDVGCGTGEIRPHLPDVEYVGFDISPDYIESARRKYGDIGTFHCRLFTASDVMALPRFDIVLAIGLLHHLDDDAALQFFQLAKSALKPDGRLVTLDPCLMQGQNPIARFLIRRDRGRNVRDESGYVNLAGAVFGDVQRVIRHTAWIPYTHCIMQCKVSPVNACRQS